jgi:hypothetical protein
VAVSDAPEENVLDSAAGMPGTSAADGPVTQTADELLADDGIPALAAALRHAADLVEAGHVDDALAQAESAIAQPLAERWGGHGLPTDAMQVATDAALGQRVTRARTNDVLVTVSRPRDTPALTVAMALDAAGAACGADRYWDGGGDGGE